MGFIQMTLLFRLLLMNGKGRGLIAFCKAISNLKDDFSQVKLVVAGRNLSPALESFVEMYRIADCVHYSAPVKMFVRSIKCQMCSAYPLRKMRLDLLSQRQ